MLHSICTLVIHHFHCCELLRSFILMAQLISKLHLRQRLLNNLPSASSSVVQTSLQLATAIFTKTRFCSHKKFISTCLSRKLVPGGFELNFHASDLTPGDNSYHNNVSRILTSTSRKLMRSTLDSLLARIATLDDKICRARRQLYAITTDQRTYTIRGIIHDLNSELYAELQFIKNRKLQSLSPDSTQPSLDPPILTSNKELKNHLVVTIPPDLPLTDDQLSVLQRGLNFVPLSASNDEFSTRRDIELFYRRLRLKAYYHDKEVSSPTVHHDDTPTARAIERLVPKSSNWCPPTGLNKSLDHVIDCCRSDINRLDFDSRCTRSNFSSAERRVLLSLKAENNFVIKRADKGGATVVWRKDLYLAEAGRQLSDTSSYQAIDYDLTPTHQRIVSDTIKAFVDAGELPTNATKLISPYPRTSVFYMLPKIHKKDNPGRPIVSACNCPTELISKFLDSVLSPIVSQLPSYVKDTSDALHTFTDFEFTGPSNYLFSMDVKSLYTCIPHVDGLQALRYYLDRRDNCDPPPVPSLGLRNLSSPLTTSPSMGSITCTPRVLPWAHGWVRAMPVYLWAFLRRRCCPIFPGLNPCCINGTSMTSLGLHLAQRKIYRRLLTTLITSTQHCISPPRFPPTPLPSSTSVCASMATVSLPRSTTNLRIRTAICTTNHHTLRNVRMPYRTVNSSASVVFAAKTLCFSTEVKK